MALSNRIFNERISRAEIQQVVLVDARRHDQKRCLLDVGRLWRIFDELDQLVFEDDRSRCCREISADLKCGFVNPGDAPFPDIFNQVMHPGRQTRRACLDRGSNDLGICPGEIGRAHRINELPCIEAKLQLGLIIDRGLID